MPNANLLSGQGGGLRRDDAADYRQRNGTRTGPFVIFGLERIPVAQTSRDLLDEDELEQSFPGSSLTHVLTIVSRDQLQIAIEALTAIRASGGGLDFLSLSHQGEALEHRLRIVGLRPQQARLLSDRLARLPGVERATVEHQLLRL